MMTGEEIRDAIRGRLRVRYRGMVFSDVRSWRQMLKRKGSPKEEWITSLELIERRRRADGLGEYETIIWASVNECEAVPLKNNLIK